MSWSTLDFRKLIKEVEKRLETETNPSKVEGLINYLTTLRFKTVERELIEYSRRKKNILGQLSLDEDEIISDQCVSSEDIPFCTTYDQLIYDTNDVSYNTLYYPQIEAFRDILKNDLKDIKFKHNVEPKLDIKEDDMFALIHDFYKGTGSYIFKKFLYIYKNRDKIINFDSNLPCDDASTIIFSLCNAMFIEEGIDGDNKEEILNGLTHEIGHAIGSLMRRDRYDGDTRFVEIESLFFEMLAEDYYSKVLGNNYFDELLKEKLITYYNNSKLLIANKHVIDNVFDRLRDLDEPYEYYVSIAKNEKDYKGNVDTNKRIKYLYSYMAALELYELYQNDPELAIEKLKEIVQSRKKEYHQINETLDLNKSVKKHTKRLNIS